MGGRRSLLLAAALAAACGGSGGLERVPEGQWGGLHVGLIVHAAGADLELDCAHGAITVPLRLDSGGSFRLPGYIVRDVGPAHDPELRQPATYSGRLEGSRLTLSFTVIETGESAGPFTAVLGEPVEVYKCR